MTTTRKIAEKIKSLSGDSLFKINHIVFQYIDMGMFDNREDALNYILSTLEA